MNKQILLAVLIAASLTGCSSIRYSCPLTEGSPCRSMSQVWDNQNKPKSSYGKPDYAKPDYAKPEVTSSTRGPEKMGFANAEDLGFENQQVREPEGSPVYITGKPYMVWVPGSKDAEGRVQSGRYVYFATPPDWTMGSLTENRNGGDILGPKKPDGYRGAILVKPKPTTTANEAQVNKLVADQQTKQKTPELFPIVRAPDSNKN